MQISLIRAVDLRLWGSRLKWTSSGFEDGAGLPFLRQYSKRGVAVVGGCILSVFAVCVLVVCLCFGGSMMGTLYAMSVAALIVVGALLLLLLD